MNRFNGLIKKLVWISLAVFFIGTSPGAAEQVWEDQAADLVARITLIEGSLERYDPESESWAVMVQDSPVGIDDRIYADSGTRVEILIPNNTVMRIAGGTEVQFVSMTDALTEIDLLSGIARLTNSSTRAEIVAMTPFGNAAVPPGASADLYVDEEGVEIIALQDRVYFTHHSSSIRHEVIAGSASLLASSGRIIPANGYANSNWDRWNRDRDSLWADRRRSSGESDHYLPSSLHDEAYVLDTWGAWHRVYYEGSYYRFWRPRVVGVGWSPFTNGAWMTWRGDRVWIPREPFGYITHHYGNWIYTHGYWHWAPPVTRVMIQTGLPLLRIGFNWYPGRVAWVEAGLHLSWIPLAPFEPYYCSYPWGRSTIVITKGSYPRYTSSSKFKYRRHVVRVHRDNAYRYRYDSDSTKRSSGNRYTVRSSIVERETERTASERLRTTRKKEEGSRTQENRNTQENQTRKRLENNSVERDSNRTVRESGQSRNNSGSTLQNGDRKSTIRSSRTVVSENARTSRQAADQTGQQKSSQVTRQSRIDGTASSVQRSGSQESVRSYSTTQRSGSQQSVRSTTSTVQRSGSQQSVRSTGTVQRSGSQQSVRSTGTAKTSNNMQRQRRDP